MIHQPNDEELAELESAATSNPYALAAFDEYLAALSALEEARDEPGITSVRAFEVAVGMARCELDYQLARLI